MDLDFLKEANALGPTLIDIRRRIHRQPEPGFAEFKTAALVAETLGALGITARTGVGKTGVVGEIGGSGPWIALRAELDALPIQELNDVAYASEVPGVMHACGHDVHTACLLGAAMLLKKLHLPGRVRFLFQPSEEGMDEEGKSGARRMLEEGALDGVQAVVGLHVDTSYQTGQAACSPGTVLASLDNFEIQVLGKAAHAAQASLGIDAIQLAAQVVSALHAIVSRRIPAGMPSVVSIGTIHGGTKENILAERVELRGTIRTFDPQIRERLIAEIEKACGIARALGGDYRLAIQPGYPALTNDEALTSLAREAIRRLAGAQAVVAIHPELGAEDFSFFTQQTPGCYVLLGATPPGQPMRPHHSPNFDIDESIIPLGSAILAEIAIRYLEKTPHEGQQ
jgi:amidohydrolase